MGQRLVINVKKDNKRLCNIYYHWSAYTMDALYETQNVLNCIECNKDKADKDLILSLIRMCEKNGGGITGGCDSNEWDYIKALYPNEAFKAEDISRNEGLISVSKNEMLNSMDLAEGDVSIDIDTMDIEFNVVYGYEDIDEYNEEMKWNYGDDDWECVELDSIPYIGYHLGMFNANEIDNIIGFLMSSSAEVFRTDDEIYQLI